MVSLNLPIEPVFFEKENRCGFEITQERKKIWAVELDLLFILDKICKKYDIKYWVDGGTMLGAVRHNGFIPWDDDIDIIMTRENYKKLCQIASKEFKEPYFLQTEYSDPGSLRGHAQLRNSKTTGILKCELPFKYGFNQGIFIDIFPLDYLPECDVQQKEYITKIENVMRKARRYSLKTYAYMPTERNFVKRAVNNTLLKVSHFCYRKRKKTNIYFKEFEDLVMQNNQNETNVVGKLFFNKVREKSIWRTEWFESTLYMPFEMLVVPVASGYVDIMNKFFGDWRKPMKLNSAHGSVFFDVEKSYIYYTDRKGKCSGGVEQIILFCGKTGRLSNFSGRAA